MDTAITAAFIGGIFLGAALMLGGLFLLSMWFAARIVEEPEDAGERRGA